MDVELRKETNKVLVTISMGDGLSGRVRHELIFKKDQEDNLKIKLERIARRII